MRVNISSGAPWESTVGYSRAVRVGNIVEVAGTTAVDGTDIVSVGDAYEQARFIFQKIGVALGQAGVAMTDVVRTRMYVTSSSVVDDVLRAHGEVFSEIRPAATIVVVSALIDERLLVEIEATAICY
ncbi:MAG: RidA family protein [Candidatus Kapabacteria bacterium]|nr:RidA family protein [Candidatus Kapabacteria bacterium]